MLAIEGSRRQLELRGRWGRTANAFPPDTAAQSPEDQCSGVKIPKDGPQSAQKIDAEDEVEAAQVDVDAVDEEVLIADEDGDLPSHALTGQAVTVGDDHAELLRVGRL
jgi:hypothetical protein